MTTPPSHAYTAPTPATTPPRARTRRTTPASTTPARPIADRIGFLTAGNGTVWHAWLVSRLIVTATLIAASTLWRLRPWMPQGLRSLAAWDGGWYTQIAMQGYGSGAHGRYSAWPFFPLLPALLRAGNEITGIPAWIVGTVLCQAVFFVGLLGLYRLVASRYGTTAARISVWTAALFPASAAFTLVYPSAIMFAVGVWAFWCLERRAYAGAGALCVVAALVRPNGIVLAAAVGLAAFATDGTIGTRLRRALICVLPATIAVTAWIVVLWRWSGDPLIFIHAKDGWREVTLWGLAERILQPRPGAAIALPLFNFCAFAGAIAVVGIEVRRRRMPLGWTAFAVLYLVPSLGLGIVGLARYVNDCFVPFGAVGDLLSDASARTRRMLGAASAAGLITATWLVATGVWTP